MPEAKNVTLATKGNILTVTIDLSKRFGLSSTGKTLIVASTAGAIDAPGKPEIKISLNAYTKQ